MKINTTLLLILFLFSGISFGQIRPEKEIRAKITSDSTAMRGVTVVNTSNYKTTISDQNGFFSILAKEGDILVLESINLEGLRKIISKSDLSSTIVEITMTPKSIKLKEVIINEHPEITAENLGIIPRGQKKYTPAERKLYTATSTNTDALINYFSGRTAMLKKEIVVEKKEQLLGKLNYLFEDKYYIETLKIPEDYIRGFQYYCMEDSDFTAALNSKNKTMTMFLIVTLAQNYNQTIKSETK